MILKRTCRERAREVYLKVFGGIVVLLLGPWIGMQVRPRDKNTFSLIQYTIFFSSLSCQAYVVLESEGDRYFRYFEIPNICLCSLLFLVSVLMICNIGARIRIQFFEYCICPDTFFPPCRVSRPLLRVGGWLGGLHRGPLGGALALAGEGGHGGV